MKKQQKAVKDKPYYVPSSVQKLVAYPVIAGYLLQTGFIIGSTASQAAKGTDFRPQLGYLIVYNLVPIIVFGIAYFLNPRRLSQTSKIFESLIISIAANLLWSILNMLLPFVLFANAEIVDYRLYEYGSTAAFVVVYITTLLALRKRGVWA